jgi:DNA-binding transcriptional MerR regulator
VTSVCREGARVNALFTSCSYRGYLKRGNIAAGTVGVMAEPAPEMTIEQLAYEVGMTVRNIRNHQTRGLLPPPVVRARTGYYGQEHVERLRLIQEMQGEGLKLSAIERLLDGEGDWAERFAGLRRAVSAPEAEPAEVISLAELEERFGPLSKNARLLMKAQKLEILINLGDGTFEVPSPALLRAAQEVVERGVPLGAALSAIEKVRRNAESSAKAFVRLFMDELFKPFDAAGQPEEDWDHVAESIERLRPLADEALMAVFKPAMAKEVDAAFGKALEARARRRG